jgi:hypothetical protein
MINNTSTNIITTNIYLSKYQLNSILVKKEMNRFLVSKYYLIKDFTNNTNDVKNKIYYDFDFFFKKKKKFNVKLGHFIPYNLNIYKPKNKNLSQLTFYLSSLINFNFFNTNIIECFYKSLQGLIQVRTFFRDLLVIRPKKGGFVCFSFGVEGFLPRSHYSFFLCYFLLGFLPKMKHAIEFFFVLSRKKFKLKFKIKTGRKIKKKFVKKILINSYIFRLPVFFERMWLYMNYPVRKFHKRRKKITNQKTKNKRRKNVLKRLDFRFEIQINIVFLFVKKFKKLRSVC